MHGQQNIKITVSRWQSFPCERHAGIRGDKCITPLRGEWLASRPGCLVPGPSTSVPIQ